MLFENILFVRFLPQNRNSYFFIKLSELIISLTIFIIGIRNIKVSATLNDTIKYIEFLVVHVINILTIIQTMILLYQMEYTYFYHKFMQIKALFFSEFDIRLTGSYFWSKSTKYSLINLIFVFICGSFIQNGVLFFTIMQGSHKYQFNLYFLFPILMIRISFIGVLVLIEIVQVLLKVILEELINRSKWESSLHNSNLIYSKLKILKLLYSCTYELHDCICTQHFWVLVGVQCSFFLNMSFSMYFLYYYMHEGKDIIFAGEKVIKLI